jgi:hypothetical protein
LTNHAYGVPDGPITSVAVGSAPALDQRQGREWTVGMVEASARRRGTSPADHLLGFFNVLDDVMNRADRPAREFLARLGRVSARPLANDADRELVAGLRNLITQLALEADIADTDELLLSWWVLTKGAVLKALDGDLGAARRARLMGADLVSRHTATTMHFRPVAADDIDAIDFDAYFDEAPLEQIG